MALTGLRMMLKALGVNFTDEHVQKIETLIPQIPERLQQAGNLINGAVQNFDARLIALETSFKILLQLQAEHDERQIELSRKFDHLFILMTHQERERINGIDKHSSEPGRVRKPARAGTAE